MKYSIIAMLFLMTLASANAGRESRSPSYAARVKREDDVSVTSLKVMVEQQASLIHTLQADLAAMKTRVQAIETKPSNAVAFTVRFASSHDDNNHGVPLGPHQTLKFDDAVTNIGHAYSTTTGIFTAPAAGTYAFFLSQMASHSHSTLTLAIVKNGAVLDVVYAQGSADPDDQGSSQVTTHLEQGDQVWVRQAAGDHVRASWYTIFTGFLILGDA